MLVVCDLQRPAAIEQLQTLGEKIGIEVFKGEFGGDPVATALAARSMLLRRTIRYLLSTPPADCRSMRL